MALQQALCCCPRASSLRHPVCQSPQPGVLGMLARGSFPGGCIFWISLGISEVPPGAGPCAARRAPTGFSSLLETSGSCLKRQQPLPADFHLPPPSPAPPHWDPPGPLAGGAEFTRSPGPLVAQAMPASDIKVCWCHCLPPPSLSGGSHGMPVASPAHRLCQRCGGGGAGGSWGQGRARWPPRSLTARRVIFNPACPTGSRGCVRGEEFGECGNLEEDVPSRREWHGLG